MLKPTRVRPPDGCPMARNPARAGRGGGDSREDDRGLPPAPGTLDVRPPPQIPEDQHGENQVAYDDRLYERETPETERHHLQGESGDIRGDGSHPQWLPDQIQQDPGRQRPPALNPLRAALVGNGGNPEDQRGRDSGYHGEQRGQLSAVPSVGRLRRAPRTGTVPSSAPRLPASNNTMPAHSHLSGFAVSLLPAIAAAVPHYSSSQLCQRC